MGFDWESADDQERILALAAGCVSDGQFLSWSALTGDQVRESCLSRLRHGFSVEDAFEVELGLILGFRFGFPREALDTLHSLALAQWHTRHEDVAGAVSSFRDPTSVDVLLRMLNMEYLYRDFGGAEPLLRRVVYGIGSIGGPEAAFALSTLLMHSDALVVDAARAAIGKGNGVVTP